MLWLVFGSIEKGMGALQNPLSLMVLRRKGESPCKGLLHKVCLVILRRIPGERDFKTVGFVGKMVGCV